MDFAKEYSTEVFQKVYREKLSDLDISILINNVGVGYIGEFDKLSEQ